MATIRKCHNITWKIRDEQGNWLKDQEGIPRMIKKEFHKRFKLDK